MLTHSTCIGSARDLEVQRRCPSDTVVYDLFHVEAKFGREVIDRVRVDQANQLREDRAVRRVIKRSRWLLLRNRDNLSDEHAIKLDELLTAGAPLGTAYLLKTQLRGLWYAPDENEATRRWKKYCRTAIESASNR